MKLINEIRAISLPSQGGMSVAGRERVVGVDLSWAGRGVSFERHIPKEVFVTSTDSSEVVPISSSGLPQRLVPYLAAPVLAIMVMRMFRAKG